MNEDNRNSPFCAAAEEPPREDPQGFRGKQQAKTHREVRMELLLSKSVLILDKMADSMEKLSAYAGVDARDSLKGVRELVRDGVALIMEGKDGGSESEKSGSNAGGSREEASHGSPEESS